MSGTVLCGVDETAGSVAAARVAGALAADLEAELVVAHVASLLVIPGASAVPNARRELRHLELEEALRLVERIAREAGCEGAELRVEAGEPARGLIALAREHAARLLVVGTGGRGPLREMLVGSVSHALCRGAPCPVVVVPPPAAAEVVSEAFAESFDTG